MRQITQAIQRVFTQPAFVVVTLILLLAAAGLSATAQRFKLSFRKLPVLPARPLAELPARLGPWIQLSKDETMPHDIQEALATDKYIFRDYVYTGPGGAKLKDVEDLLASMKEMSPAERKRAIFWHQAPSGSEKAWPIINLGLTYYTGLVDTVAHIPERCLVADGYEPTQTEDLAWDALRESPGSHMVRHIVFEDQMADRRKIKRNIAYFFNCNGEYTSDSIAVRKRLANLLEQYGYYMKIEMQTMNFTPQESAKLMNDLLQNALPEAEKSLPDWKKLTALKSPG